MELGDKYWLTCKMTTIKGIEESINTSTHLVAYDEIVLLPTMEFQFLNFQSHSKFLGQVHSHKIAYLPLFNASRLVATSWPCAESLLLAGRGRTS